MKGVTRKIRALAMIATAMLGASMVPACGISETAAPTPVPSPTQSTTVSITTTKTISSTVVQPNQPEPSAEELERMRRGVDNTHLPAGPPLAGEPGVPGGPTPPPTNLR